MPLGVADHLTVEQQPSGFAFGSSCTAPLKVAVRDSTGAVVTGFSGEIAVVGLASNLTGPTILPVFSGFATFRRLASITLGALTIAASCAGLTGVSATPTTVAAAVGTFYRTAELPRATPSLPAWMATQASGAADVTVVASSAADLQSKITTDAALTGAPGNLNRDYLVPDGVTWLANIEWPNRDPSLTGWMRVRSASNLPTATGTRVSATALLGKGKLETASASAVFKTVDPNVGAQTNIPHHYAIAGLTIRAQTGMGTGFWLIGWGTGSNQDTFAKVPHHFVLDRCVVDGANSDQSHGLFDAAGWNIVRDCAFLNIHSQSSDGGHAITMGNGDGPALIENNTLQCSGVIVLIGGSDPNVSELIPSDITIRGNLLTRDLLWNRNLYGTAPIGTGWLVKNNLDIKNSQRVLVEGNIFENSWTDGQGGSLTNYKSVNQGGFAPWCGSTDLVIRRNFYRNANEAYSIAGRPEGFKECVPFSRYVIEDSLVVNIPSHIRIGGGGTFDGYFNHLTWHGGAGSDGFAAYVGDDFDVQTRFTFINVLATPGQNQGVLGQTTFPPDVFVGPGTPIRLPGATITKNVMANAKPGYSLAEANWPAGNFINGVTTASVGYVSGSEVGWSTADPATDVVPRFALAPSSPYHNAGTDGTDIGANMTTLAAALSGVVGTPPGSGVVTNLVFDPAPTGVLSNQSFGCTVKAVDETGTVVTSFMGRVSLAIAVGRGQLTGPAMANGRPTVSAIAGAATFSGLKLRNTRGPVEIAAITEDA